MNAQVIALVNQKSGLGKSTSCVNLGVGLAQAEKRFCWLTWSPRPASPSAWTISSRTACPSPLLGHDGQSTERSAHRTRRGHPVSPGWRESHALGHLAFRHGGIW